MNRPFIGNYFETRPESMWSAPDFLEWYNPLEPRVKEVIQDYPPNVPYLFKSGDHCSIISYGEPEKSYDPVLLCIIITETEEKLVDVDPNDLEKFQPENN